MTPQSLGEEIPGLGLADEVKARNQVAEVTLFAFQDWYGVEGGLE